MSRASMTIERTLSLLAEAPGRLEALAEGVEGGRLRLAPEPDAWPATEVLAHLRACADMWGGSIERIVAEGRPTIRAVNPRTWIDQTDYRALDFAPSLRAFAEQRAGLIALLERLPAEGWARSAAVTGGGAPRERTVADFAVRMAVHERPHIRQIERTIAAVRA